MPLFSTPLSGLKSNSDALSVISNNLANLNTTGYKGQSASFRDLFYQTVGTTGSGDAVQVGSGVNVGSISSNFNNGSPDSTGVKTDVAISGDGFFVVEKNGLRQYTRDGHFKVGDAGYLTTQDGQSVLGYPATNGTISSAATLSPLQLNLGLTSPASPTSAVSLNANLSSSSDVGATYATPLTVYDSLGSTHVLQFTFTKTAANTWSYDISLPKADLNGVAAGAPSNQTLATGTLGFDGAGELTTVGGAALTAANGAINVTLPAGVSFADGASTVPFKWNLLDATNTPQLTQTAAKSATSQSYQDGYSSGTLTDYSVTSDGTVQGTFSNNQTIALGRIALATFANNQGLTRVGGNSFTSTLSSGEAVVGAPGTGGRGSVAGGKLEGSNVDMATEFSKLIITQRGYQANAKVVTAFDEVTQATINLKQ